MTISRVTVRIKDSPNGVHITDQDGRHFTCTKLDIHMRPGDVPRIEMEIPVIAPDVEVSGEPRFYLPNSVPDEVLFQLCEDRGYRVVLREDPDLDLEQDLP
jgi:hypothetical protein